MKNREELKSSNKCKTLLSLIFLSFLLAHIRGHYTQTWKYYGNWNLTMFNQKFVQGDVGVCQGKNSISSLDYYQILKPGGQEEQLNTKVGNLNKYLVNIDFSHSLTIFEIGRTYKLKLAAFLNSIFEVDLVVDPTDLEAGEEAGSDDTGSETDTVNDTEEELSAKIKFYSGPSDRSQSSDQSCQIDEEFPLFKTLFHSRTFNCSENAYYNLEVGIRAKILNFTECTIQDNVSGKSSLLIHQRATKN